MELGLAGRSAIVTGGASNIGRAIVRGLVDEGALVTIADVDEAQAQRVADESPPERVFVDRTDVTDVESVEGMVQRTLAAAGAPHILVNCAGWTIDRLFLDKPRSEWEREIAVDIWGFINVTRALLPHMVAQRYGRVVSIGSDAGRIGEWREAVYSGTKASVIAMSKSLARELGGRGITFNVVCPGIVPGQRETSGAASIWSGEQGEQFTPEILEKAARAYPLRRVGTPEDIVPAVLFLASDCASYITGQTLSVSGGYTMM
ncbi:MAG: SDR family NAD(P)-dependent oxidoreductase [Candidatus Dormibacteria bacterium]|jgi:2-hydroxycyclohexanecarboxyl-CoA dehydrogenase